MNKIILIYLFSLLIIPVYLSGQGHHSCPLHPDRDYENPLYEKWLSAYDVKFYHIDLEADNETTVIDGHVTMLAEAVRPIDTLVLELQDGLIVSEVNIDSAYNVVPVHVDHALYIPLSETKPTGELISVTVHYGGDADQNRGFFAGLTSGYDSKYDARVTYTLSEPQNARDWFPVKQVLGDKIDSAWIYITCHKDLMAASNGILGEIENISINRHKFKWKSYYPMSYYLISFTVADYTDYSFMAPLSGDGDSVLVQNYIYDNNQVLEDWEEDILNTGDMIHLFSNLMSDYPFAEEKYGHAMAPIGGGMEHQTMTTLTNFNFSLVAHELAHQWFGDYITCGSWQDIWINEGFASYMEYIALENLLGQEYAENWMAQAMSIALSENDGSVYVPASDVEDSRRLFSYALSYKKGAALLHMIRYEIDNDDIFFDVLRIYLEEFGNGHATAENFRKVLEEVSSMDFSCFFDQWYYGHGYPNFSVSWYQQRDTLYVFSSQTPSSEKTPFFSTHFDLLIKGVERDTQVRVFQSENETEFKIPAADQVVDIVFDPDNKLLKSASVRNQLPESSLLHSFGPNPFSGGLTIRFRNYTGSKSLAITSLDGKEIKRYEIHDNPVLLDLSELSDGPYLMVINDGKSQILEKILKISE